MAESKWVVCCLLVLCPLINFGLSSIFSAAPFQYVTKQLNWHLKELDIDIVYPTVIVVHIIIILTIWIFICCCTLRFSLTENFDDEADGVITFEPDQDLATPDSPGITANQEIPPMYNEAIELHTSTSMPPSYNQMLLTRQDSFLTEAAHYGVRPSMGGGGAPLSPTSQGSFHTIFEDSVFDDDTVSVSVNEATPINNDTQPINPTQTQNTGPMASTSTSSNSPPALDAAAAASTQNEEVGEAASYMADAWGAQNNAAAAEHDNTNAAAAEHDNTNDISEDGIDLNGNEDNNNSVYLNANDHRVEFNVNPVLDETDATQEHVGLTTRDTDVGLPNGAHQDQGQGQINRIQSQTSNDVREMPVSMHSMSRLTSLTSARQTRFLTHLCASLKQSCLSCFRRATCNGNVKFLVTGCALVLFVLQFVISTALLFILVSICGAGNNCARDLLTNCPVKGWIKHQGACYLFLEQPRHDESYNESLKRCESTPDATLAYILDSDEESFLRDAILKLNGGLYRTGGHSAVNGGDVSYWPLHKNHYWYKTASSRDFVISYKNTPLVLRPNLTHSNQRQCLYIGTLSMPPKAMPKYHWYISDCKGRFAQICRMDLDCGVSCYVVTASLSLLLLLLIIIPCLSYCGRCLLARTI